jgi:hypothetical protein
MRIENHADQTTQDPSPLGPPRSGIIPTTFEVDLESGMIRNERTFSVRSVRPVPMLSTQLLREQIVGDTPSSSSDEVAVALPTGAIMTIRLPRDMGVQDI